ncbi:MAG: LrgB family protein [Bacteroidales bacterium]|nr:LrgB family protein [Bacteroidales bacterium]
MTQLLHSDLFMLFLVLGAYLLSSQLYLRCRFPLFHPLLVSIALIIVVLKGLNINYESFKEGSRFINFLLGPAVVALGYVLFEQLKYLRGNVIPVLTSITLGSIIGVISVLAIAHWMNVDKILMVTLMPKSTTTPIAMEIARNMGGIPALTAVVVVVVGIFGGVVAPYLFKIFGIEDPIAKGLAMGTAAHGVGTAAAMQIGVIEGAFSGLAIGLTGVITALISPFIFEAYKLFF